MFRGGRFNKIDDVGNMATWIWPKTRPYITKKMNIEIGTLFPIPGHAAWDVQALKAKNGWWNPSFDKWK